MSKIPRSAGITTAKSINTAKKKPVKQPLTKKVPVKEKKAPEPVVEPTKVQSTETVSTESTTKVQSTETKKTRKPRAKKNAPTKAPPFKPTVMFIFTGLNGANIAEGYLRGAGMTYKSGKIEDRPAIQIEGRGTLNKEMVKLLKEHLKKHRIQYEEEKV